MDQGYGLSLFVRCMFFSLVLVVSVVEAQNRAARPRQTARGGAGPRAHLEPMPREQSCTPLEPVPPRSSQQRPRSCAQRTSAQLDGQTEAGSCPNCTGPENGQQRAGELGGGAPMTRFDGGNDCSQIPLHGFDAIIAGALRAGRPDRCRAALRQYQCLQSPWRGLDLQERIRLLIERSTPHARAYGVDVRGFPCTIVLESETIEPLAVSFSTCDGNPTGRAMPQIIEVTFRNIYLGDRGGRFYCGRVEPFASSEMRSFEHWREAFNGMALNIEFQLEMKAAIMRSKAPRAGPSPLIFSELQRASNRVAYGASVYSCFECLARYVRPNGTFVLDSSGQIQWPQIIECLESPSRVW